MELLVKGARIVDYSQDFIGDIYIKDGIIEEIGLNLNKSCQVIHREGLTILPSFIDTHAHFRDPGLTYKEDIESGSRAAAAGGYTGVLLMANTKPVVSSKETLNYIKDKAKAVGLIDIVQAVSITRDFNGYDISHLNEIDGITVISEDGKDVLDPGVMINAMKYAKENNILVMCHCEDNRLSKENTYLSEDVMTWRNVTLSGFTGCKTHICHVSTKGSMEHIIYGKSRGFNITCEVTPHHISLNKDISKYSVNPPIRDKEHVDFLIDAIKKGYVDTIGTDHAPHSKEDKEKGAPGISGIETAFSVCYDALVLKGHTNLQVLSKLMSYNPAKILNLKKGAFKVGFHGDFVVVDLNKKYIVNADDFKSKGKNTPYSNMELCGKVIETYKKGTLIFKEEDYDNR